MQASPEFLTFARWSIQDIDRIAPTLKEMYDFGLRNFQGEERVRLRDFLDRAVREASDATLERLWRETDADLSVFPAQDWFSPTEASVTDRGSRAFRAGAGGRL